VIMHSNSRGAASFVCLLVLFVSGLTNCLPAQDSEDRVVPLPAESKTLQRIAFGSCAKHWQYQPIWKTVITKKPDLFLFLGDAIYADTDGRTAWSVTEKQLQGEWNRLADKPEFQQLRAQVPIKDL